jgi:cytochrome c-type biogenesis protein CcmH/NrfG
MTDGTSTEELRRAVVSDPRNAELRYLFGAELAQQRDYDGAVMEWTAAAASIRN